MVQYLVEQNDLNLEIDCEECRVDATSEKYEYHTALQTAVFRGSEDILHLLVARKDVDVNATGGSFGSALCAALSAGNMACIESLLDQGADIDCNIGLNGTALELAITENNWPLVDSILDCKYGDIDINNISPSNHKTAFVAAIESGSLKYVNRLLLLAHFGDNLPEKFLLIHDGN